MFCTNCGNTLNEHARFCAYCGAAQRQEDAIPAVPASGHAAARQKRLIDRIMDLLIVPVAIILILIGIGSMALTIAGKTATAQVTGYEQVMFVNNDDSTRNPSRYKLEYQFSVNDERYTGSVTRVFSGGSHMRQTLQVRYLPFWPHVNAEDGGMSGSAGPIMMAIGVVLLVFGAKNKSRLRNKSR